jgi:hypothetical protein
MLVGPEAIQSLSEACWVTVKHTARCFVYKLARIGLATYEHRQATCCGLKAHQREALEPAWEQQAIGGTIETVGMVCSTYEMNARQDA